MCLIFIYMTTNSRDSSINKEEHKSQRSYSNAVPSKTSNSSLNKKPKLNLTNPKRIHSYSSINERLNELNTMDYLREQDILLSQPVITKNINNHKCKIYC